MRLYGIQVALLPPMADRTDRTYIDRQGLVLVADSVSESRDRLQHLLEQAGYTVVVVPTEEAGAASRSLHPGAVVLQLGDPAVTGLGMVREFRTHAETRGTPLIILLRFDDAHTRELIVRAGATAILIEPVKPSALLRHLRRLLARAMATGTNPATQHLAGAPVSGEIQRG